MRIVLLSGGSGKRLWPLSNDIRAKQFIRFFREADGSHVSMLERVYQQVRDVFGDVPVTIATSAEQVAIIKRQLGGRSACPWSPAAGILFRPLRWRLHTLRMWNKCQPVRWWLFARLILM